MKVLCPISSTEGGTDVDGTPYFVLKNSWSEFWGDDGYMRIAATPEGMCGLGSEAYFPVL